VQVEQRTCIDCGRALTRPSGVGRWPTRCAPCNVWNRLIVHGRPGSKQWHPDIAQRLPHPRPCKCQECWNAQTKLYLRKKKGIPLDWDGALIPCDVCGWSFGVKNFNRKVRICSVECRQGRPSGSCRLAWCPCGTYIGRYTTATGGPRCAECKAQTRRDTNRRKNLKRRSKRGTGRFTLAELGERDGWRCHLCGKRVNPKLSGIHPKGPTVDHLVPVSEGGVDELSNVALAHHLCNSTRGTRGEVQLRLVG
jgi:hypothetical protein